MQSMPKHEKLLLLQPLMDEIATLSRSLNEQKLKAPTREIAKRLRVILSRSKEEIKDFGGFYCIRLLLDQQSSLASFFIDLFSHLEFLLLHLRSLNRPLPDLLCTTRICRLLYATCQMLPFSGQIADPEFKREGRRQGRQFSGNLLHCRMRHMASVYLDQPGCSRVNLEETVLGSGAYATVYKGVFEPLDGGHVKTGHFVAVKMFKDGEHVPGSSALGPNFGSKLLQTMQQMTDCLHSNDHQFLGELDKLVVAKHPNIVTPIGYIGERAEGKCGIVMELMDESLSDYLQKVNDGRVPPLKELDMLDLMLEIARGMRFLHECELIHLDLKPQNVLLRFEDGNDHPPVVKLADLGLTTLLPFFQKEMSMGEGMAPLGTPCYMAPELLGTSPENLHYDDKVDVFSYGTTCFNILVGNPNPCAFSKSIPCFYEATKTGCWKQWVQGRNPFLVKLIGRCWEMDPSMRPTFTTLCILLQKAIEWLMAPSYQTLATPECSDPASITKLKLLNNAKKLGHIQMYHAISAYYHRIQTVVGLEVIERCIMRFESHVRAKHDLLPRDAMQLSINMAHGNWRHDDDDGENGNQLVKDVSMFLQACRAKGSFNGVEPRWKRILKGSYRPQRRSLLESGAGRIKTRMVDERCLDEADPLVFIKAQAYFELLRFLPTKYDGKSFGELGSSIRKAQQLCAVDLSGDDARVPLQVDSSLIPLLVGFWIARRLL